MVTTGTRIVSVFHDHALYPASWNDVEGEHVPDIFGYVIEYDALPVSTTQTTWSRVKRTFAQ